MTVAIQPPLLLPQLGFFDLMRQADVFILLDRARFEETDSQNRTRIKTDSGPVWLTVPVIKGAPAQRITDMMIDNGPGGSPRWTRGFFHRAARISCKAGAYKWKNGVFS